MLEIKGMIDLGEDITEVAKPPAWRRLYGFRSKTPWKMILAIPIYLSFLFSAIPLYPLLLALYIIYYLIKSFKKQIKIYNDPYEVELRRRANQHIIDANKRSASQPVRCPKCHSEQITANKNGFSAGKAVAGAVMTGGIGLLFGLHGNNKINITCLKCGNTWRR